MTSQMNDLKPENHRAVNNKRLYFKFNFTDDSFSNVSSISHNEIVPGPRRFTESVPAIT